MAPAMKYAAALALLMSSVRASPVDIIDSLADWTEEDIIADLSNNQEGTFIHSSEIDWNAPAIDSEDIGNLTEPLGLHKRAVDCNNRPSDINAIAICGPRFVGQATRSNDRWGPAWEAMPQWNHARLNSVERSCYPEFADNDPDGPGTGPNPGLPASATHGQAVGTNCVDPNGGRPYSGPLMKSRPFPVYVDAVYCPGTTTWRIIYNVYYPKDFNHRHDWERAIIVFGKDVRNGGKRDWWARINLLLGQHSGYNRLRWDQATAHNDRYSSSPVRGAQGAHPRVFPGMYHHATFNEAKTSCLGPGCAPAVEYRRNNWQYSPIKDYIRHGKTAVPKSWGTYGDKTTPNKAIEGVCGIPLA